MESVKNIFNCLAGNTGLTEEFVYYSLGKNEPADCKILSSATSEDKMLGYIPHSVIIESKLKCFYHTQGILVVRKGKAGRMFFLPKGNYVANDDAYILSLKEEFAEQNGLDTEEKQRLFLKYYIYYHQHDMYDYASSSDNGTWNKTGFFQYCCIDLPSIKEIKNLVERYEKCTQINEKLCVLENQIKELYKKNISLELEGERVKLKNIFSYISRNDCLSQEGIYKFQPKSDNHITVLSGATNHIIYGKIDEFTPGIHYLKDRQCLHVVTRGKAGKITYMDKGTYATNTNAFLLFIEKERWKELNIDNEKEEKVYLKYMLLYLQPLLLENCSRADVSVLPLTEVMKQLDVVKVQYNPDMIRVVDAYDRLCRLKKNVEDMCIELDNISDKSIII